jgi:uncharacterized protein YcbK (DUF882 family)
MKDQTLVFVNRPVADNFHGFEFRCQCCGRIVVSLDLVRALQALRSGLASPCHVLSGYRCPIRNMHVGGAPRSWHTLGLAADIRVDGVTAQRVHEHALSLLQCGLLGFVSLYADDNYVHVDTRAI